MNGVLERQVTSGDTVPEMVIDFERMVWTCAEHGVSMPLDSGEDCPRCRAVRPTPREVT